MSPSIASLGRGTSTLLSIACLAGTLAAQSTPARPQPYALTGVKLSDEEDAVAKTIVLRDGLIEKIVDATEAVPADARVIDGEGFIAFPAFIDAYSTAGCETPTPVAEKDKPAPVNANVRVDMREANRKGIQPSFRAADVLALQDGDGEKYREAGFGALLSSPHGQLLAGSSVLATTRSAAMRDVIASGDVFHHAAFNASGNGYPSTLMGYHAQLRQFFIDARRHGVLKERYEAGRPGGRPPFDADLDAGLAILAGERPLLCEAETARDVERWIRFADEFGLKLAIAGGRDAWKVAELLVERDIPVFMTLDWGDEVDDPNAKKKGKKKGKGEESEEGSEEETEEVDPDAGEKPESEEGGEEPAEEPGAEADEEESAEDEPAWEYEEPLGVRLEKRREWEEKRDSALRLREAGARVVFCSGAKKPKDLLKNMRTLVENGFPRDDSIAGLTSAAAEELGADRHLGHLRAGHDAAVALWTKHPMEKGAQVVWLVVDGFPYEFEVKDEEEASSGKPDEGVDLTGKWKVEDDQDEAEGEPTIADLTMDEDGKVTGTISFTNPMDGTRMTEDIEGQVSGKEVNLSSTITIQAFEVTITFKGEFEDDAFSGERAVAFPGGDDTSNFTATREPDRAHKGAR